MPYNIFQQLTFYRSHIKPYTQCATFKYWDNNIYPESDGISRKSVLNLGYKDQLIRIWWSKIVTQHIFLPSTQIHMQIVTKFHRNT